MTASVEVTFSCKNGRNGPIHTPPNCNMTVLFWGQFGAIVGLGIGATGQYTVVTGSSSQY